MSMKLKIDERMFENFHDLVIGVIIAKGIDNNGQLEEVQERLRTLEEDIREKFNAETLSQHPKIDVWRKAYSAFGAKPKEHKSSVENLYCMILQGGNVRHINTLVDLYNLISLQHMVPVGGEDIDKVRGDIILTFAESNENPVLLLGDKESRVPHAGEVIYKDEVSAICRRWNWREADRTKLTAETRNCILVIEGIFPITRKEVERATLELRDLIQEFCRGKLLFNVMDEEKMEIEID